MCGVVGLFHPESPRAPDGALLRRMADALRHRGPDGEGFHVEPGLALGHRRLAIIDLAGGHQPMCSTDGRHVVSFNGEIFNHEALRTELEGEGHRFRTRSDTEVLLHGWRAWGMALLDRLNGQFAFALWDQVAGHLLLARDRLGEKPLHYARLPDRTIAFASEAAGLLAIPSLSRMVDREALDDFLALGYVPDPGSIHAAIRQVPPGHVLHLKRNMIGLPPPRRYWQPPTRLAAVPAEPVAEMTTRLAEAVRLRLVSDVPVGCFLSGGVDSAGIAVFAAREGKALDSFTIGLPGADERAQAREVAATLPGRHHLEEVAPDPLHDARRVAAIFGAPFGDSSAVPTHAVSALARRHVTVALSGDGGDEVFAGYRRYRWHQMTEAVRRLLPAGLRRPVLGRLARAYPKLDRAPRWLRAKHTLTELSLDSALGYYAMVEKVTRERRHALFAPRLRAQLEGHDPGARFATLMAECDPEATLLQAQYADLHTYLPGDILTKVDRASMAVSLEVRPPLLDHTLVEWGMALPTALKLRGGVGKQVLRDALRPHLPAGLLDRPKQGFAAPLGGALRARMDEVRATLLGPAMLDQGFFDDAALRQMLDEHEAGRSDHGQALWQLLVLEGFFAQEARPCLARAAVAP
jgi:asparagine synthase (glutamine-hydrolysing)